MNARPPCRQHQTQIGTVDQSVTIEIRSRMIEHWPPCGKQYAKVCTTGVTTTVKVRVA
jgi:hypothetical protein